MKDKKKYYILVNLVFLILLIAFYYWYINNKKDTNIEENNNWWIIVNNNSQTWLVSTWVEDNNKEEYIADIINRSELTDECKTKKDKKDFASIFLNYSYFKDLFLSWSLERENDKEYNVVRSFSEKNCSLIDKSIDLYTYELCDIFFTWDYTRLDTFKFIEWETKEKTLLLFNSISSGKALEWLNKREKQIANSIINFEKNKTIVDFKLQEKTEQFRWDVYTYLKENWKRKFLQQLENSLNEECKKL